MEVLTKDELEIREFHYLREIDRGKLFIYPTDTIYGIGCDATNSESVAKIRLAKNKSEKPFSVIAPSKSWIYENCVVPHAAEEWIEKLPGPYTLIFKLRTLQCVAPEVLNGGKTLGVRLPHHWFVEKVKKLEKPVVTTSVNPSGEMFMTSLETLHDSIEGKVAFVIYEGEKIARPSTLVKLHSEDVEVIQR